MQPVSLLFVCLGNICRSPTAHGVCLQRLQERGLSEAIKVDSAGTGDWHVGAGPDSRATEAAAGKGYDLTPLRARSVTVQDFYDFDYILAMDRQNLADLQAMAPADARAQLALLLDFGSSDESEVPDPYYGGDDGFGHVLSLVEDAVDGLLARVCER